MAELLKHNFTSSHLLSGSYDPVLHHLTVTFQNGRSYTHANITQAVWDNFLRDFSPGKFYHSVIKRYPQVRTKT